MKHLATKLTLLVCLAPAWAQTPPVPSLRGTVTDPSGAAVPGAAVQLRGPSGEKRARTDASGQYAFSALAPGKYRIRVSAKNFSTVQSQEFAIDRPRAFDLQLEIGTAAQVITVRDEMGRLRADPESNGSAVIMRERQIAALSDDPDELAVQLQALAGPSPGPNGGEVFVDGFSGGTLPPKSAIRELRVNSNPFSPEYDRPGFGRIEIFTKPGSSSMHGEAFAQYNDEVLNSRNPLLTQSARPPFRSALFGLDLTGPLKKDRASFTLDLEHRHIDESAFVLATALDANLSPVEINQVLPTPQSRTSIVPRLDYRLSRNHTMVARYQEVRIGLDNQGVGDFNLASRAYNARQTEHTAQVTETATIGTRAVNETRFQFSRAATQATGLSTTPGLYVQGAFFGGGPTVGNSGTLTSNWELTNASVYTRKRHTLKWGGRLRQSRLTDTSYNDFAGTFTFFTLAQYQATLALEQAGYSGAQIAQMGAGPSQFSISAGTPATRVDQTDAGLYVNDDWRARPGLTLSYGLRYERQSNLGGPADWAPRVGIAWGLGKANRAPAAVVRAGFGVFYDRIPASVTLNSVRYNGVTRQSYLILNPDFFPAIPPATALSANRQPLQLRPVASGIEAPRLYQVSAGIDRQFKQASRLSLTWIGSRGVHLLNSRNIDTPIGGSYPLGDRSIHLLTESTGYSRQNQLVASANVNRGSLTMFGYYVQSYGRDNNGGLPADPYDLRAEWGPSAYGDIRHKTVAGASFPLWRFSVSPFVGANSGSPYDITTGLDPGNTGFPTARPALLPGASASACRGVGLLFTAQFGCFDLSPAAGMPAIERNFGRGPAAVNLVLRVSRTWAFGKEGQGEAPPPDNRGGHDEMPVVHGPNGRRRYSLTLSAFTLNALNHPNFAPPSGDLSSPYFGQPRSLGGLVVLAHGGAQGAYNRKIDLQLRLAF